MSDFDRQFASWIDAAWPNDIAVDVVEDALVEARSVGRPSRATRLLTGPQAWPAVGEVWVFGRRRSVVQVLVAAALIVALVSASIWAGSQLLPRRPAPFPPLRGVLTPAGSIADRRFPSARSAVGLGDGRVVVQADDGTLYAWTAASRALERLGATRVPRGGSTLLAMPDGRVGILGGDIQRIDETTSVGTTSTLEFFDPATGATSGPIPMSVPRDVYRAIVLRDGRIVAGGGATADEQALPVDAVEIFDPRFGRWSPTDRVGGLAVPMPMVELLDGRVLFFDVVHPSTAIFDPSTGAVTPTPDLAGPYASAAVALPDGRVLIFEGACHEVGGGPDASGHSPNLDPTPTEIFDPTTDRFSPGPTMPHCVSHAAALASGEVFVTGWGYEPRTSTEQQSGLVTWGGLVDAATGVIRETDGPAGHYLSIVALPDGRAVAFVTREDAGDPPLDGGVAELLD